MSWNFSVYLEKRNKKTGKWELAIKNNLFCDGKWYILEKELDDEGFENRDLSEHFDNISKEELSQELQDEYKENTNFYQFATIGLDEYCQRIDQVIDKFNNEEKFILLAQGMKIHDTETGELSWNEKYEKDMSIPVLKNLIYTHQCNVPHYEKALRNRGMIQLLGGMMERFDDGVYEPFNNEDYRLIFIGG